MTTPRRRLRCAVYTRKSSDEGLQQDFNSLDAQREACEAYIKSQAGEGWQRARTRYDDGGVSGGTTDRPALQKLLADVRAGRIDTVVVYKVDRLTRSLADFSKIVEVFDANDVSFVSVTQQFNTTTSMGRLTLNMLLSFAQFEREVTGERIRDKIAASKKKGMWMGGFVPLGYEACGRTLFIIEAEADTVRKVFRLYLTHGNVRRVKEEADRLDLRTKRRTAADGRTYGNRPLSRGYIYKLLNNPLYVGRIAHKGETYEGQHAAIIDTETWEATQAELTANANGRRAAARKTEQSLLAGLLYGEDGSRFTPTHAVKNGLRYRYYVQQSGIGQNASMKRIPAREIEELIGRTLTGLLEDPVRLVDEFASAVPAREQTGLLAAAKRHADAWPETAGAGRRALLEKVSCRVVIGEADIRLELDRVGLINALSGKSRDVHSNTKDPLNLCVAARLRRASRGARFVICGPAGSSQLPKPDRVLIDAVVRAHVWNSQLKSAAAISIRTIAKELGLSERYVSRILRLAFLAPDITEAILDGRQPHNLDLKKLTVDFPHTWADQRATLGFGYETGRRH